MGNSSRENRLNDLSAQEWLRFTKTWFVHNPKPRKKEEKLHPAKYPEDLIEDFIRFFTKERGVVFDPFLGTGSTLVACHQSNRNGIGIELQEKYALIARERLQKLEKLDSPPKLHDQGNSPQAKQLVLPGDANEVGRFWNEYQLPLVDLVITSPPYGPMLNKKGLITKERQEQGLDVNYSEDHRDLGNASGYDNFVEKLIHLFAKIEPFVKKGGHVVVILQNYMDKGEYKMLAWDVARAMTTYFQLRGERIWCQDNKTLYPYGYRYRFVPNVHHHYCLIFRKKD